MNQSSYEEFKYMLQDTGSLYIGAKFTYRELMEHPELNFKFKSVIEHYIFKEADPDTSLESEFYYMTKESFTYRTYEQLKTRVKINIIVEKKGLFGKKKRTYVEKIMPLKDFVDIPLAQKKRDGVIVQEMILSKLALMSFVL